MLIKQGIIKEEEIENQGFIKHSDCEIAIVMKDEDHDLEDEDTRKDLERVKNSLNKHSNKRA